jgi:hypothetical protein
VKYRGEIKDSAANTNPNMEVERKKIKNSVTKERNFRWKENLDSGRK